MFNEVIVAKHDNSPLSQDDQQWIKNNLAFTSQNIQTLTPGIETNKNDTDNADGNGSNLKWSVNGGCKNSDKTELVFSKNEVILKLKSTTIKTAPRIIAELLENLFSDPGTYESHWLYIAQHYTPRAINRVIAQMTKLHRRGDVNIQEPAKYFTCLVKFRRKKKSKIVNPNQEPQVSKERT